MLEKTLESPLDCKEIQPVHSEGDQPWDFFGGNDAEAGTLGLEELASHPGFSKGCEHGHVTLLLLAPGRLEGKPRTPLSSRVATRVSWSPLPLVLQP